VTSDFRRDVDEDCTLLGYYATNSGISLPTFRDNLSIPFSTTEEGHCHYHSTNAPYSSSSTRCSYQKDEACKRLV